MSLRTWLSGEKTPLKRRANWYLRDGTELLPADRIAYFHPVDPTHAKVPVNGKDIWFSMSERWFEEDGTEVQIWRQR